MKKKLIVMVTAMASVFAAHSMTSGAEPDTLKIIDNPKKVSVYKLKGNKKSVQVLTEVGSYVYEYSTEPVDTLGNSIMNDWSISLPFLGEGNVKRSSGRRMVKTDLFFNNAYVGALVAMDKPAGLHGSFEIGIGEVFGVKVAPTGQGFSINLGVGFGYRLYTVGANRHIMSVDRNLVFVDNLQNMFDVHSRIKAWTFHVPVMFTQKIYRSFGISAGAWVNFNTYTTASVRFHDSDLNTNVKYLFKDLHQRLLTVDLFAAIGSVGNAGLYVRYSPMRMFEKEYGPDNRSLSFGVTFGF